MTQSKILARLLTVAGAAIAALALLAPAASATEPNEGYEQFAGCPSPEEPPAGITLCQRVVVTGGHFEMGTKDVPLENPIEISGGGNLKGELFANENGGMSESPQKVPGGLVGLTGLTWLLELFGIEALTLYATTELAGQPKVTSSNSVQLPIRVHLTNPAGLLGSNCYVGGFFNPIVLNLTTGTTNPPEPNEPITGTQPESHTNELGITVFENGVFVDNAFAAPESDGCELILFGIPIGIDGLVSETAGLPAAAGTNETIQEFEMEIVPRFFVY